MLIIYPISVNSSGYITTRNFLLSCNVRFNLLTETRGLLRQEIRTWEVNRRYSLLLWSLIHYLDDINKVNCFDISKFDVTHWKIIVDKVNNDRENGSRSLWLFGADESNISCSQYSLMAFNTYKLARYVCPIIFLVSHFKISSNSLTF
jgi:hypothetical protein